MTYQVKIGNGVYLYQTFRENGKVKCRYVGKLGETNHKIRKLIRDMKKHNVSNVKFDGRNISLDFDGKKHSNRIVIKHHLGRVGAWARGINEIYYDDDLLDNEDEQKSISVHETIEKYLCEKYGLSEHDAHIIAENVEKIFAKDIGINWRSYSRKVNKIHVKESNYAP